MHQSPLIVFLLIIIILIHNIPRSHEQYAECDQPFRCGFLNAGYPFWGGDRPYYCGYSGFELTCRNSVPLITIRSLAYRVLAVDGSTTSMTVARDDLWNETCPSLLFNTTLDFSIFNFAQNDHNLTLYYGCPPVMSREQVANEFTCTVNGSTNSSFFVTRNASNRGSNDLARCNNNIYVPIVQEAARNLSDLPSQSNLLLALNGGFGLQWSANNTRCSQCVESGGRCGHNSTTDYFVCYCADRPHALVCNSNQGEPGHGNARGRKLKLVLGISVSSGAALILITIFVLYRRFKKGYSLSSCTVVIDQGADGMMHGNVEAFMRSYGSHAPKLYTYAEIKKITNSFSDKLGQGGYGSVYKGILSDGRLVAVKLLSDTKGNGEEFINEVASISRTSHVNVVSLFGFSYKRNKRALIYEYMPNGSLDRFIYKKGSSATDCDLDFKTKYQIAVGIARGLEYLHRGCSTRIVHFDIKPHNILLDQDFCPKISDFGLAKLCERKESILSMLGARGTIGYIAPEVFCRNFGGVSHKSDVYSYGMMVFEMVGGRKDDHIVVEGDQSGENYFPDWIYEHLERGDYLRLLQGVIDEEDEQIAKKMIIVSLWCIQTNPKDRPPMNKVVDMLEGGLHSLQIPPKPFLYSPKRSPQGSPTSSSSLILSA